MAHKKILVVDDESKIRELLDMRLSSEGYDVIQAKDGEEAVLMAKKHKPDLILMDVMMPKMDGAEAAGVLGRESSTKDIPVIFLTSMITKEEEESQAFGIQLDVKKRHFIAKPFETANLLAEIQKSLNA
jgi:CheY-like chemotaxis protein